MSRREQQAAQLKREWSENPRWAGVKRAYAAEEVVRLRGRPTGVDSLAFSPDGHFLVAGARDGMIQVWDGRPAGE